MHVQEIRSFEAVTRIADTPAHVLGAFALRGSVVPVVDLRLHLRAPSARFDADTVTVVITLDTGPVGVVVDAVCDVVSLAPDQIRPLPGLGALAQRHQLQAIATVAHRMVTLMDIARLLDSPEIGLRR